MTMTKCVDSDGRSIEYLRLSLTRRCELRYSYCAQALVIIICKESKRNNCL